MLRGEGSRRRGGGPSGGSPGVMETRPPGAGGGFLGSWRGGGTGSAAGRFTSPLLFLSRVFVLLRVSLPAPVSPARPAGTSPLRAAAEPPQGGRRQRCWWGALAVQPAGNMATGGYRSAGGSTTDFLEEWKAKREKMRAKQAPAAPAGAAAGGESRPGGAASSAELNNNLPPGGPAPPADRPAPPAGGALNCLSLSSRAAPAKEPPPPALAGVRGSEPAARPPPAAAPGSPEGEEKLAAKGKSSGPSARKGKGQIEKRKLREKRRSTGVVNIPAAEVSPGRGGGVSVPRGRPPCPPVRLSPACLARGMGQPRWWSLLPTPLFCFRRPARSLGLSCGPYRAASKQRRCRLL